MCLLDIQQGLSQDLESGCPKSTIVKFGGVLFFKGGHNILRLITTINIYLLIEIGHYNLIQCHGDFVEVKIKVEDNYMLEIDSLRNFQLWVYNCVS